MTSIYLLQEHGYDNSSIISFSRETQWHNHERHNNSNIFWYFLGSGGNTFHPFKPFKLESTGTGISTFNNKNLLQDWGTELFQYILESLTIMVISSCPRASKQKIPPCSLLFTTETTNDWLPRTPGLSWNQRWPPQDKRESKEDTPVIFICVKEGLPLTSDPCWMAGC